MGVPGYSNHNFNYILLTFFLCGASPDPRDAALVWDKPLTYMGSSADFGNTDEAIRTKLLELYHSKGIKVLVSVFGATQPPTSWGLDAVTCADQIADYVTRNKLDGVDIDY